MRAALFLQCPLCVLCLLKGITVPATIRDHIIPLAEGGVDDNSNCQAICQQCSDAKTRAESTRGQQRAAAKKPAIPTRPTTRVIPR